MLTTIMRHSDPFVRLRKSSYRRQLHLNDLEKQIVLNEGFDKLAEKCKEVVYDLQYLEYTHKDTPYRGIIPKAQHATAACCRKCLFNWHRIPRFRDMTEQESHYVIVLILRWIKKETAK